MHRWNWLNIITAEGASACPLWSVEKLPGSGIETTKISLFDNATKMFDDRQKDWVSFIRGLGFQFGCCHPVEAAKRGSSDICDWHGRQFWFSSCQKGGKSYFPLKLMTLQQFAFLWVCTQFPSTVGRTQRGKGPDELMQSYIHFPRLRLLKKSRGGEEEALKELYSMPSIEIQLLPMACDIWN